MGIRMRDIAAAADVSLQTVSNTLNGRPGVSEQTRARVLDVARRLGYVRNAHAAALRTQQTGRVGLFVVTAEATFPADTHQARLLAGITGQLLEQGLPTLLPLFLSRNLAPTAEDFAPLEQGGYVTIVLLFLPRQQCRQWVDALMAGGWPCVFIEQVASAPQLACVLSDQQQGAFDATQYLLRQGHRHIAFLAIAPSTEETEERCLGYNRAMALWGIRAEQRTIVETEDSVVSGYKATIALCRSTARPTAIVTASDFLGLGAIEAAHTAGLRVPEDLAVVGFEDMEFSAHLTPALSSVRLPDRALGAEAARLAIDYTRTGRFAQAKVILPAHLYVRASSVTDGTITTTLGNHEAATAPGQPRRSPFRIGVSLISVNNPWRASVIEQLRLASEREPDVTELLVKDAQEDAEQQARDIEDLSANSIDALIVDPGAGMPLVHPVEEAVSRGIPVILMDSAIPTERYTAKVGPDEVLVGKVAAEDLLARMGAGNIVLLEGPAGWPVVEERSRGIALVLRQHREVRVLATAAVPRWSRERAKELMRDWLLLFPTIDGVLAHDGLMAMGAWEAAREAGRAEHVKLGLIGTYNRALKHIADTGEGKSVLIPTWIGAECLRVALCILRGEAMPKWVDMGLIEITKENVRDWYEPSKAGDAFESLVHE
ncbi:MAG: LacI family DNA-binding transcriptional regulator [Chloroflexi bacterium]|nr:LacI family DNA-binding transcriptional regulator [Chloroflexota bacterium]